MKTNVLFLSFISVVSFFLPAYCAPEPEISGGAAQKYQKAYIIPIEGIIDLGLSGFVKRSLAEAKEQGADTVILEIDTLGGRVDAALDILKHLQSLESIKTIAFIKGRAWSAGALISLSCEMIIMSPGSSIGSAEPRAMGPMGADDLTDEKTLSAIRAEFKSTAEAFGHSENLALAMVDKDIEVKLIRVKGQTKILSASQIEEKSADYQPGEIVTLKTISPEGKLLNLTAKEAEELGLSKETKPNLQNVLSYLGIEEKNTHKASMNWSEKMVRFITHPLLSPLLLSLGFLGIMFELRMPGWGISGTLGIMFLSLFFWGHHLAGLANWPEIILFSLGVILLIIEIFILPGFGLAGFSGIALIIVGIFLALIKYPLQLPALQIARALHTLGWSFLISFAAGALSLKLLPKAPFWNKIVLTAAEKGFYAASPAEGLLGKTGRSASPLRPSGKIIIEEKMLDALTLGEFIGQGKPIQVVKTEGAKIIVEEIK